MKENRDIMVPTYLSESEKEEIEERAEDQGLSVSSYLRLKGLEKI